MKSLQEYVLVGSVAKGVEVFRRSEGAWLFMPYGEGDEVKLASVDVTVSVAAVYEDVVLGESSAAEPTGKG